MARLRYNNAAGALGSPALTATATTITFAAAPSFATIVSPDFIPLVLDPPAGPTPNPNFEIVYLTAYTSGATVGTVTRGAEGTTGIAHGVGAVWAQAPTLTDLKGQSPVGTIVPYAGYGDPPENNWLICDGRLIDGVLYPDFLARVGHAYNYGSNPGNNGLGHQQVRIPDKRGKQSMGAINMGSLLGAGPSDNYHAQGIRGALATPGGSTGHTGGEVVHALASNENGVHNHWGSVGQTNLDHFHYVPINFSASDGGHSHTTTVANTQSVIIYGGSMEPGHAGAWTAPGTAFGTGGDATAASASGYSSGASIGNAYSYGGGGAGYSYSITQTYGGSAWYHGHAIPWDGGTTPSGGGSAGSAVGHNNVSPYELDCYIVRIA
jgi:hypothetical protein